MQYDTTCKQSCQCCTWYSSINIQLLCWLPTGLKARLDERNQPNLCHTLRPISKSWFSLKTDECSKYACFKVAKYLDSMSRRNVHLTFDAICMHQEGLVELGARRLLRIADVAKRLISYIVIGCNLKTWLLQ